MIQINFSPFVDDEIKQHHEELIRKAAMYNLAREVEKSHLPKPTQKSKVLASIGKQLVELGNSLEDRFGAQMSSESSINQRNSEGCL